VTQALANVPLMFVGLAGLYAGMRVQKRVQPETYKRVLRYVLFVIALVLLWQGSRWFW
jgi:uncharacterized membrane protein YfcA